MSQQCVYPNRSRQWRWVSPIALTQQGVVPDYIDKEDERAKVARAQKFVAAYEKDSGVRLPAKR